MTKKIKPKSSEISKFEFSQLKLELEQQGRLGFEVVTNSMEPIIAVGDFIEVEPLPQQLNLFDIVVFWNGKILISHYIWHQNMKFGTTIITKNYLDGGIDLPIERNRVLGLVTNKKINLWQKCYMLFIKEKFKW